MRVKIPLKEGKTRKKEVGTNVAFAEIFLSKSKTNKQKQKLRYILQDPTKVFHFPVFFYSFY
jgi:hypothetical protein